MNFLHSPNFDRRIIMMTSKKGGQENDKNT